MSTEGKGRKDCKHRVKVLGRLAQSSKGSLGDTPRRKAKDARASLEKILQTSWRVMDHLQEPMYGWVKINKRYLLYGGNARSARVRLSRDGLGETAARADSYFSMITCTQIKRPKDQSIKKHSYSHIFRLLRDIQLKKTHAQNNFSIGSHVKFLQSLLPFEHLIGRTRPHKHIYSASGSMLSKAWLQIKLSQSRERLVPVVFNYALRTSLGL